MKYRKKIIKFYIIINLLQKNTRKCMSCTQCSFACSWFPTLLVTEYATICYWTHLSSVLNLWCAINSNLWFCWVKVTSSLSWLVSWCNNIGNHEQVNKFCITLFVASWVQGVFSYWIDAASQICNWLFVISNTITSRNALEKE